jgi:lipase chaperone LimK
VDPELATMVSTVATTLVRLLTTDGWERAKSAIGSLWQRVHPDHAAAVEAELADSRAALLEARDAGDDQAERDLEAEWRGRLRYLVAADPAVASELPQLVQDLRAALSASQQAPGGHVEMHAHASGHGQVYQAGRDQRITRS